MSNHEGHLRNEKTMDLCNHRMGFAGHAVAHTRWFLSVVVHYRT